MNVTFCDKCKLGIYNDEHINIRLNVSNYNKLMFEKDGENFEGFLDVCLPCYKKMKLIKVKMIDDTPSKNPPKPSAQVIINGIKQLKKP